MDVNEWKLGHVYEYLWWHRVYCTQMLPQRSICAESEKIHFRIVEKVN